MKLWTMMMKQARDLFHLETLLRRARCAATRLINNAMKPAHDSFHLANLLLRAMCTATELTTLMSNTTKQTLDWLWTNIRATCTAKAHVNTEPCARWRSSWTTLKQARHRLFLSLEPCAHGDRVFVNQLRDNDEHRSWFVLMVELVL